MKIKDRTKKALTDHIANGFYADVGPGAEICLGVGRRVLHDAVKELIATGEYKTVKVNVKRIPRGTTGIIVLVPANESTETVGNRFGMISPARMMS